MAGFVRGPGVRVIDFEADPPADLAELHAERDLLFGGEDHRLDKPAGADLLVHFAVLARVQHEVVSGLFEIAGEDRVALLVDDEPAVFLDDGRPAENKLLLGVGLGDCERDRPGVSAARWRVVVALNGFSCF